MGELQLARLGRAVLALGLLATAGPLVAENIDPLATDDQYAYGENIGWVNAEPSGSSASIAIASSTFGAKAPGPRVSKSSRQESRYKSC